ncbi:pyridoxamine 5'-phosphate oxidase family protein [Amycolatopsis anabasis]|uniref:pyridoxamine 5'-phosphate oxidase family protein n=1 Tax=Amycolatopsis anabasis TaxID=1840409 RepID=UPI00131B7D89|nr:pyridoxamine 5'-phosphate oxidase family protein [Amycolatopsis anabasis]
MEVRRFSELSRAEALRRLGSVGVGRIVFTEDALPAIRPVNHVVDGGAVIIRSHAGAALLSAVGTVVAYEADVIEEDDRIGWSVIVTGVARQVRGAEALARYHRILHPWVDRDMEYVIRIEPELVTGFALSNGQ